MESIKENLKGNILKDFQMLALDKADIMVPGMQEEMGTAPPFLC